MRIFEISQSIVFKENSCLEEFKKGDEITFSGYFIECNGRLTGYMRQEATDIDNSTIYIEGKWHFHALLLIQALKFNSNNPKAITWTSFFPSVFENPEGYLDEVNEEGIITPHLVFGNPIAKTHLQLNEIEEFTEYMEKKEQIDQEVHNLIESSKSGTLYLGFLFNFLKKKPNLLLGLFDLLKSSPRKPH